MSDVASVSVRSSASVKPLHVLVVGKVVRVRRYERFFYTTVICPAKDEFSKPSVVEVRSRDRFGEVEDRVSVTAELGGYEGKAYQITDRESGERKTLVPVNLFLDLVSA